ncbi:MAG: hypothetical protein H8E44_37900 [Planctomycetes bacterium]|nr:hypothetical protein [Planctomycetota bacterium]MBL7040755.1 hypothetical protein [Pirellulaceae bacterium]
MGNDKGRTPTIWDRCDDGSQQRVGFAATIGLPADEHCPIDGFDIEIGAGVAVTPIRPTDDAIAVALVTPAADHAVARNGIPLPVGLHPLRHADRLDVGDRTYWLSGQKGVEETEYDPDVHGEDVYCMLTKARLAPGQSIKICPGREGRECGVIYKSAAWDMFMESGTPTKCPNCGYHSGEAEWEPPQPKPRRTLDGLLPD